MVKVLISAISVEEKSDHHMQKDDVETFSIIPEEQLFKED